MLQLMSLIVLMIIVRRRRVFSSLVVCAALCDLRAKVDVSVQTDLIHGPPPTAPTHASVESSSLPPIAGQQSI
jgi:hypothetical protein